ncbi:MAG TPA: hypothetical protein VLG92_02355 [Candidatus Saccharimonadia bacterium]|nr:hypothetical protein [Candidatus Saccharimonadia bacterium]
MQKQMFAGVRRYLSGRAYFVRQGRLVAVLALVLCVGGVGKAAATTTSSSSHYSVTETQFGPGSALSECSSTYCAKVSSGDTTVGRSSSTNYSALFGENTSDIPVLAVSVTGGTQNMGVLDDTHTGTATSSVKVTTYLSSGYVMQVVGASPSQGAHNLNVPLGTGGTPFTSQQGTEQFGINLVANTAPSLGADPVDQPAGTTDTAVVKSNYATNNEFAYTNGDIVAQSTVGNGEIDYTLSMIINVSKVTPGGQYSGSYSVVVVPTF